MKIFKFKINKQNVIATRLTRLGVAVLFLLLLSKTNISAQDTVAPTISTTTTTTLTPSPTSTTGSELNVTPEVKSINKTEFSGEVTKIDDRKLTIKTSDGTKEVTVPQNVQVKKNSLDSNFGEIKVNDKVSVAQSDSGEVLSVSATSAEVSDFSKRALPIVIGVLVLIGIIYYLFNKGNKGHIKTSTEQVNE